MNETRAVLHQREFAHHCHALEVFARSVDANLQLAANKVRYYKWFGLPLLTVIPLSSALLSVLVSLKDQSGPWWLPTGIMMPLSLFLTLFTILNSIFMPSERFSEACRLGIGIERFIVEFLADLEKLPLIDESTLVELTRKKCEEFEKYKIELIGLFMPLEAPVGRPPEVTQKIDSGVTGNVKGSKHTK